MDIIWIIFAGLMFCGTSKKKPGLMVPFIGLVGLMNVVRTIITDFTVRFSTGRDSATFRDKGTEVSSLSRDNGTS